MIELFRTLVADPPWPFGDKLPGSSRGAAKNYGVLSVDDICGFLHEAGTAVTGQSSRIEDLLAPDCRLFLWRVSSMVEEAYRVARAWGFDPTKGELVWVKLTSRGFVNGGNVDFDFRASPPVDPDLLRLGGGAKVHFGMGRTLRASHETCLVGEVGDPELLEADSFLSHQSCLVAARGRPTVSSRSVRSVFAAPNTAHSSKPDAFYELVERLSPGPYLELFGRRRRPGWTVLGDELDGLAAPAVAP